MNIFYTLLASLLALPLSAFAQNPSAEDFVPITAVPTFDAVTTAGNGDFSGFFNQLYILCVGAAAVIAVVQIMIAGFRWATSAGSHSAIEEARSGIQNSVLGLILVLSPAIVFGIINPDILSLKVDTSALYQTDTPEEAGSADVIPENGTVAEFKMTGNGWGAIDDKCDFSATGPLEAIFSFGSFYIKPQVEISKFGKNSGVAQGRLCCTAAGGTITKTGEGQEVCDLNALIEEGRYTPHIKGTATILAQDQGGVDGRTSVRFHFYTSGAGDGTNLVGDVDTIAIHGFRDKASCDAFLSILTPQKLTEIYKGRKTYPPLIGLLEGKYGAPQKDLLPSKLISVDEITETYGCEADKKIKYGVRN